MPVDAVNQLAGYGPVWAVVGLLFLGMAAVLAYIARTHASDRQEWRLDMAAERKQCVERDAKLTRGLKRVAVHQRETNSAMSELTKAVSRLADDDSKKKPWNPHQ